MKRRKRSTRQPTKGLAQRPAQAPPEGPPARRGAARSRWLRLGLLLATILAVWALPWDLHHLSTAEGWQQAWARLGSFAAGFAPPDTSARTLARAADLAAETLAIAILGVGLGLVLAWPLAVLASARALDDGTSPRRRGVRLARAALREVARVALDTLRGIPDFAWALVLLTIFGPNAVTATLAIALQVAGILGKVFSELWDGAPRSAVDAVRGTGARRLQVLLYGIQPLAGRGMLSFVLMRLECAVRNASVIGAVCGGGLGGAILQELGYDNKHRAVTFLAAALALTVATDLASNALRRLLRSERGRTRPRARRNRRLASGAVLLMTGLSLFALRDALLGLGEEFRRLDLRYLRDHFGRLLAPDLSAETLAEALAGAAVPLALGLLATLVACGLAGAMAWWGSASFQLRWRHFAPERVPAWIGAWRALRVVLVRLAAVVARGVPEVAWVWILALFFLTGVEAALGALVLHSAGILARVFIETVDNLPYPQLENVAAPSRVEAFAYGALPLSRGEWRTYALFQFESNVRTGVLLGIVGVGGLGHMFRTSLAHGALDRASTFLLAMVVLTATIDRLARRLGRGPRC